MATPLTLAGAFGIPFFTAKYALQKYGITGATITVRFAPEGKYLIYSQTTRAAGLLRLFRRDVIHAESILPQDTRMPLPKEYHFSDTGGGYDQHAIVHFDRKIGLATGNIPNGNKVRVKILPNTLDRLSLQLALMQAVAENRKVLRFTTVESWNKLSHYTFRNLGETVVDTSMGELKVVHLERLWNKRGIRFNFWLAPSLHYLPVRLEQTKLKDSSKLVMVLESVQWDHVTHEKTK